MKKTFCTPQGTITREITREELLSFAAHGDQEAKQVICKEKIAKALSLQDEIDAIKELLDL